ncbi:MAG TPA: PKD domain-containing protein [Terriglobales bacterium]|nr:PKD domain-containing protein [Terriglobales bacterium]
MTSLACGSSQHFTPPSSGSPGTGSGAGGSSNGGSSPTNTTLQGETGNNTAAADSFAGETNGNGRPGNVSKAPMSELLYSGAGTKIYAHYMPWFGSSSHMNVGYRSDDPVQVKKQVEDMISRGIQGAIVDWYGPASTLADNSTKLLMKEAEGHAGFTFAVMEDAGALVTAAEQNGCDVTTQLIADLNYLLSTYASSSAYMKVNGKTPIFMFGVTGWYEDWSRVQAALPSSAVLIFRGGEGLTLSASGGAFQWLDINSNDPFDEQISAQDSFYRAASGKANLVILGSAYKGFNDTAAEWSTNRVVDQRCGQTWLDTFADIGKHYSASNQLGAVQIVTWNDYEEGTAIEPGIDNCVYLVPSVSGNTLNWSVNGGSEATIDHYTVFSSNDGQNLTKLAAVPAGTHAFDLSSSKLTSASLYVKATGKPSIRNVMSAPVAFRAGDTPPEVTLSVTQPSDLTINASLNAGSPASSRIDFGDGTVMNGTSAVHKYATPGRYVVTATAFDQAGASAIAVTAVEAKATGPGVTIFAPANAATVNWPTTLIASANSAAPIARMNVYIDGQLAYAANGGVINANLKVFTGSRQIVVEAIDAAGTAQRTSVNVVAEPGDLPPNPVVSIRPLSGNTVLACSAGSHDPDGFLLTWHYKFSDGADFFTPAAVHTLPGPGTYSVGLTVSDQFGATGSTSQSFSTSSTSAQQAVQKLQLSAPPSFKESPRYKPEPIRRP